MRKEFLYLLGGLLILGLLLYFISPVSHPETLNPSMAEASDSEPSEPLLEKENSNINSQSSEAATVQPTSVSNGEVTKSLNPAIQMAFSQNLRSLGACLETPNSVPGDELEPTLQTLVDSIRGEWGESVISTEDWMQIEMVTPEGEKRRLRVEMDFDSESQVQRKLKFMALDGAGATTPISIPEEQTIEPSESLIASLESGNTIQSREKMERIYFQNGEEIVAKQKDGYLVEIEVNKGSKTFKCTQLNVEGSSCQCLQ